MSSYIIAPKRKFKGALAGWQDRVQQIPGVEIVGHDVMRLQISATPQGIEQLRSDLGDRVHIEESISHTRSELAGKQ